MKGRTAQFAKYMKSWTRIRKNIFIRTSTAIRRTGRHITARRQTKSGTDGRAHHAFCGRIGDERNICGNDAAAERAESRCALREFAAGCVVSWAGRLEAHGNGDAPGDLR